VLQANPFPYLGGFKTVGNPEVTNSVGGFSFPFLGLNENAQLRVMTVGRPVVSSLVVLENVAVRVSFLPCKGCGDAKEVVDGRQPLLISRRT